VVAEILQHMEVEHSPWLYNAGLAIRVRKYTKFRTFSEQKTRGTEHSVRGISGYFCTQVPGGTAGRTEKKEVRSTDDHFFFTSSSSSSFFFI